jgi:hypothetical protein
LGLALLVDVLAGKADLVAAAVVVAADVFGLADGDVLAAVAGALEGAFFLSSFVLPVAVLAAAAPGLAALTVVFFFLTAGLLSVDPVDDFRFSCAFLAAAVDDATAAMTAAVAGLMGGADAGFGAVVGGTCFGGMVVGCFERGRVENLFYEPVVQDLFSFLQSSSLHLFLTEIVKKY